MRYRALDENGDMQFGGGAGQWMVNSPEAVAQAVKTRLLLMAGEWFLDVTEGTPYSTEILGEHTATTYDWAIRNRIALTPGVSEIQSYASQLDSDTRALSVQATISTIYGTATIAVSL